MAGLLLRDRELCAHEFNSRSAMFRQFLLHTQNVLRSINAEVRLWGVEHLNSKTVLQCSQLFERFRALERGGLEPGESAKHTSLVTVNPDVSQGSGERRA